MLKDTSGSADTTRMLRGLGLIASFPMTDDPRWRESVLWSVCRFLLRHKPDTLSVGPLAEVVVLAAPFVPLEACLVRSVWWRALLRHADTGIDWLGLFDQHGWEGGFRPDDEETESYGDGRTSRPLVEGLIQAVARQLLQLVVLPDTLAAPWLARIDALVARHSDWDFLPYYQARLLLRLDQASQAMRVFLPVARLKKREFWVWAMLAELVSPEQVGMCYARALTLGTPETFLVKLRQRVAAWLIAQDRWADARAEIDRLLQTREVNGWPIPLEVQHWLTDTRYMQAAAQSTGQWYSSLLTEAHELLWHDLPETVVLVTGVDSTGQYVNVAIDAHTRGSFPARKFEIHPAAGAKVAIRYTQQQKEGRLQLRVQTAALSELPLTHLQTRTQQGPLRLAPGKGIGFVGDIYVPADRLTGLAIAGDTLVTVDAVASWDSVKKQVGWRAFRIQKE
ncbi:DUF7017 domain-containing protein [Fibrella arboris]|uniref:DUF7017 domain-containing protein n=1 Tax=Fibrella arboris TaxID=3242486 RepID=UPI0035200653